MIWKECVIYIYIFLYKRKYIKLTRFGIDLKQLVRLRCYLMTLRLWFKPWKQPLAVSVGWGYYILSRSDPAPLRSLRKVGVKSSTKDTLLFDLDMQGGYFMELRFITWFEKWILNTSWSRICHKPKWEFDLHLRLVFSVSILNTSVYYGSVWKLEPNSTFYILLTSLKPVCHTDIVTKMYNSKIYIYI